MKGAHLRGDRRRNEGGFALFFELIREILLVCSDRGVEGGSINGGCTLQEFCIGGIGGEGGGGRVGRVLDEGTSTVGQAVRSWRRLFVF